MRPGALSIQPKFPGWDLKIVLMSNGSRRIRTVAFQSTRKTRFVLIAMEDVDSLLLVLELLDDFNGDISDIVWAVSSVILFFSGPYPDICRMSSNTTFEWRKEHSKFSREFRETTRL